MTRRATSDRRQFLTGRSAAPADATGRVTASYADQGASRDASQAGIAPLVDPYHVRLSREAMACRFEIFSNAGQHAAAVEAAMAALDLIDGLEEQISVYRDTSELTYVNRWAHTRPVVVETRLFDLLASSIELHRETGGAFDITSGPLSKAWGFYRRAGQVPSEAVLQATLPKVGSHQVRLDDEQRSVFFEREGVEINLGSIGKGYALDRADEALRAAGVQDFLWHGGQSSVLARGSSAAESTSGAGWRVGVRHPLKPDRRLIEIRLFDRALGASGTAVQFFRHAGKRYGHILDPRTGWPAEGMLSSTALCDTAAEADALATAFYVMGPQEALAYCSRHPRVGAILLYPSASGSSVELAVANLDDGCWRMVAEL